MRPPSPPAGGTLLQAFSPARLPPPASDALRIADGGIEAVDGYRLVQQALKRRDLRRRLEKASRVYCVALGKVANPMFDAVAEAVPEEAWAGGVAVSGSGPAQTDDRLWLAGGHPLPDGSSRVSGDAVSRFLARARLQSSDLVIVCVSGGTSSMISAPVPPLTIGDLRELTLRLLRSGADVTRMNHLRRVVSSLHGGGLASIIAPAACLGLILSDNVQAGTPAVGSGPTYPLASGYQEALEMLERIALPQRLRRRTELAIQRRLSYPLALGRITNVVVGRPLDAAVAAQARARALGYDCLLLTSTIQGEAREVARVIGSVLHHRWSRGGPRLCVLAAGEVAVTVRGSGRGGRCQELAWAMSRELAGWRHSAFAAVATDGRDYLEDVGGAWVTDQTFAELTSAGFDWSTGLGANDTYPGLAALGNLLPSRQTATNLCDLYVACLDRSGSASAVRVAGHRGR